MSPATTPALGDALFVSESAGAWSAFTVALAPSVAGASCGSRLLTWAVLVNEPASTSAWVTV